jgi:hypothetical protein
MDIIVTTNKKRIPIAFLIGLLASIIFYMAISNNHDDVPWYYYLPAYIVLFIYAFIFTLITLFEYVRTMLDKNAILKISNEELYDNLGIFSCGKISWSDLTNVEIVEAYKANFLVVKLSHNSKYMHDKNFIQRYVLNKWIKKWGSPIVISEKRINYNLYKLKDIILEHKK